MVEFLSPAVRARIIRKGPVTLTGSSDAIGGFMGDTTRGPMTPVLIGGLDDFREVFGPPKTSNYLFNSLKAFFDEGGSAAYVKRIAHYSDVTDATTLTALFASLTLLTGTSAASAGSLTSGGSAFPVALVAGDTFGGKVDGGGTTTITITAVAATKTGAGATYAAVTASHTLVVNLGGFSGNQTITFAGTENTQALYLTAINSQLLGGSAVNAAGQIKFQTDWQGSGATGSIVSGDADVLASLGLTVSAFTAGSGNVARVNAVTAAELASLFNANYTGSTATTPTATSLTWTSNTTGASSSVQLVSGTGGPKVTGFDTAVHSGSASSSATNTLTVKASSPGAWGNAYSIQPTLVNTNVAKPAATTAGTKTKLTLTDVARIAPGDTISIAASGGTVRGVVSMTNAVTKEVTFSASVLVPTGGLLGSENVVNETFNLTVYDNTGATAQNGTFLGMRMSPLAGDKYVVNAVNNAFRTPITVIDLSSASADPRPATIAAPGTVMASGSDGGSIVDADYIGDISGKTGFYGMSSLADMSMLSVPGISATAVVQGGTAYAERRAGHMYIPDMPQGLSPTQMSTWLTTTANIASMYVAVYWPWVKAIDVTTGGQVSMPPSGFMQGIYARVVKEAKISQAPAGEQFGQLRSATGLDYDVSEDEYDLLYPKNINAIKIVPGAGVFSYGSRTLDPTGEFGQVPFTRVALKVKKLLETKTRFVNFLNNNEETRSIVTNIVKLTLRQFRVNGDLAGKNDNEAFFVQCDEENNTASIRAQGLLVCRIGLAFQNPAEFVYYTIERDTRAILAEIASTQ